MIKIVNVKKERCDLYCGRPTILGNPFSLNKYSRDEACDLYEKYFHEVLLKNEEAIELLHTIQRLEKNRGTVILGCYCTPLRCHCETIKSYIESIRE